MPKQLSRRDFLKLSGVTSAGMLLAACGVKATEIPTSTSTLLPSLTPLPTQTNIPTATATPLPPTLRSIGEKLGMVFGTTLDGSEDYQNSILQKVVGTYFSSMMTGGQIMDYVVEHPGWAGWATGKQFRQIADQQKLIFYLHPGFYPRNMPERLSNAGETDIVNYMNERISNLLDLVEKVDDGYQPTYLNFVNEAIWDGSFQGQPNNVGWYNDSNHENSLYRLFGKKWISEVYVRIFNQAKERGINVGKDLIMVYNDAHISSPNPKVDLLLDILSMVKQDASQALGVQSNQIQLDTGIQLHLSGKPELSSPGTYITPPTDEELLAAMKSFSSIGRIHLTEFDVKDVPQQERIETMIRIFKLAISSGYCKSITLWDTFRFKGDPKSNFDYGPNGLFDTSYQPTDSYNELVASLSS